MPNNVERPTTTAARLGVGRTSFHERFVDHGDGNDLVPGTDIKRLRPVPLGAKAIGFLSDEVDALIEALRRLRDATARRAEPEHLRAGRDRYWKRERKLKKASR
jgi:hypothetical protein